jgi:hypothetical protein
MSANFGTGFSRFGASKRRKVSSAEFWLHFAEETIRGYNEREKSAVVARHKPIYLSSSPLHERCYQKTHLMYVII